MGLAIGPDGLLYATQHGRDQLHDNWPKVFPTSGYQAENPGEEFIQVNEGDDFGWPYCYYAMDKKQLVDAPEYGGDGTRTTQCADKKAPRVVESRAGAAGGVSRDLSAAAQRRDEWRLYDDRRWLRGVAGGSSPAGSGEAPTRWDRGHARRVAAGDR
jgi:hypothetical protein